MSDVDNVDQGDNQSYSGSESGSWRDTTATLRRNARNTTDRKKKKTVSFIMNEELANIIHSSGTMTKKDSILKDPTREREHFEDGKGRGRPTKRSPTKVPPPMPETPKTPSDPPSKPLFPGEVNGKMLNKSMSHPAWEGMGGSVMEAVATHESKLVSTSKIRIEVNNGGSSTLPRGSTSLHKSQSFSADLSPLSGYRSSTMARNNSGSGLISQADLQKAKMQLRSSQSFPELLEDGDNSSSGVSSDQDQDSVHIPCEHTTAGPAAAAGDKSEFVTKLTVSNGRSSTLDRQRHKQPSYESETDLGHVYNNNNKSVTMTGPIGPVHIEWSGPGEEEHHYQNFATMMQQQQQQKHQRTRNLSRSVAGVTSTFYLQSVIDFC